MPTNLIDTATLNKRLASEGLVVVDCRYDLRDASWGYQQYLKGHVPGAVYVSLDRDLSGEKTGSNGRHPKPDPATLAGTFGRLGIDSSSDVVAYDQDNGIYASRLWWLLRWLGHDRVAVLDGGFAKWTAEGRAVRSADEPRTPARFVPAVRSDWAVDAEDVERAMGSRDRVLVDARAPERYRGDSEPLDRVAGHIPGAINHFFKWNLTEDNTFRTPEEIRARVRESIGDVPLDRVICYCGSGVTACHNLLAFEHAGLTGSRLYVGSWSEWSSDPGRPVEKGEKN